MTLSSQQEDWRILLLGEHIQKGEGSLISDVEESLNLVPTSEAISDIHYDFFALYVGSDSCPSCRSFSQTLLQNLSHLERKRCKVIFVSNDKDAASYDTSIRKLSSLEFMCYSPSKTQLLRGYFNIATVPALLIFRNENFSGNIPAYISNARYDLVIDPECLRFPWPNKEASVFSAMDRLLVHGQYGKWWHYGHRIHPGLNSEPYMDDHAVRARAGILHVITWLALIKVLHGSDDSSFQ
jgi:thiol-disulfide isomerase/thioredoxin